MAVKIQLRRGPADAWIASNPLLSIGEIGFETDTYRIKFGDGERRWRDLPYLVGTTTGSGEVTSVAGRDGDVILSKGDVGLSNVDNVADMLKPVSAAQAAAIARTVLSINGNLTGDVKGIALASDVAAHTSNTNNPHLTTKAQIGLSSVDNTSDKAKPISDAVASALSKKADLENGKLPVGLLPPEAITDIYTVASQAVMVTLTSTQVQKGDVAICSDGSGTFMFAGGSPATLSNWKLISAGGTGGTPGTGTQGPQGEKGDKGDPGPQGPAGSGSPAGTSSGAVSFIYTSDPVWKLTPYNAANPVANNLSSIIAEAHRTGKTIFVDNPYLINISPAGDWGSRNLRLFFGPGGKFIGGGATTIRHVVEPSPEVTPSTIGSLKVGLTDSRQMHTYFAVPQSDLQKFGADMSWQLIAKAQRSATSDYRSGFYTSSLPGTVNWDILNAKNTAFPSGDPSGGKVVMAENFEILGVSFKVSSSADIEEHDLVVGATSGAKMQVASAQDNRILTRRVTGTFKAGETIKVNGSNSGTISDGVVVMKGSLLVDWTKLTVATALRKLGGSQGGYSASTKFPVGDYFSNLEVSIENAKFDTMGDPNAGGSDIRGTCIALHGSVGARIVNTHILGGYARGIQLNSTMNTTIDGYIVQGLPNNTQTFVTAFGYGVEVVGASTNTVITNARSMYIRHLITTNPTANSQFLSYSADDTGTWRHGIPRYLYVKNCHGSNMYGPTFDTHHLAENIVFSDCSGNIVTAGGRKDSGKSVFQNRATNVTYINCLADGGAFGFTDATAGCTVFDGDPNPNNSGTWPLSPIHSTITYINCTAINYELTGFRQGLAAESKYHSYVYADCSFDDGGKDGSNTDTTGFSLMGTDTTIINPRIGRTTLAVFEIEPGGYWNRGPAPSTRVPAQFNFIGTTFADLTRHVSNVVDIIRIEGASTANTLRIALPDDLVVMEKIAADKEGKQITTAPTAWVHLTSGRVTIANSGATKNVGTTTRTIPTSKVDSGTLSLSTVQLGNW